jgi:hypothetical protein
MDPACLVIVVLEESVGKSNSFLDLARGWYGEVGTGPCSIFALSFGCPNWGIRCLFGAFSCVAHSPDFFVISSKYDDGLEAFCERSIELVLDDGPFVVVVHEESRGWVLVVIGVGHNLKYSVDYLMVLKPHEVVEGIGDWSEAFPAIPDKNRMSFLANSIIERWFAEFCCIYRAPSSCTSGSFGCRIIRSRIT